MKKLINGIIEFRNKVRPNYRETFAKLALGQEPDTLFIACSDSRVVPNLFASTDPGDLFVVRNVGNLIPRCGETGTSYTDVSEAAALEFSLLKLNVPEIIICGHSECGAMAAVIQQNVPPTAPNLKLWLTLGNAAYARIKNGEVLDPQLSPVNQLSQINVLQQLDHVRTYPMVRQRIAEGKLRLHAWWFDIARASVFAYEEEFQKFLLIDEKQAERILAKLGTERSPGHCET